MIYESAQQWNKAKNKNVLIFGMSGLGKTHLSKLLRKSGGWFHYSVDYRIGTHYMGEHIVDNVKLKAMENAFLANLLKTDSIYIRSNITFENLAPLSTYLGQPGAEISGGLNYQEYVKRQNQHLEAEKAAMLDTVHFIDKARNLYNYPNFICDSSGSLCEIVDPNDPNDFILNELSKNLLLLWIEGDENHNNVLKNRFKKDPKPMYYNPTLLSESWSKFKKLNGSQDNEVDPNAFAIYTYEKAISARQPKYRAMCNKWGVSITANEVSNITSSEDFDTLIAKALNR